MIEAVIFQLVGISIGIEKLFLPIGRIIHSKITLVKSDFSFVDYVDVTEK